MRMGNSVALVLLLLCTFVATCNAEDSWYHNSRGLSFRYPVGLIVQDWKRGAGVTKVKDFEVTVRTDKLPLAEEDAMGFDNENIQKLRAGIAKGIITGFPFNYESRCKIVTYPRLNVKGIKSYRLCFFALDDIQLEIEYILFYKDNMFRITIDANAFIRGIITKYHARFFESSGQNHEFAQWKDEKSILDFIKFLDSSPQDDVLQKLNTTIETIYETIDIN